MVGVPKKSHLIIFASTLLFALLACMILVVPKKAQALSGSQFQAGRIIDDAVFYDTTGINAADIQSFFTAKVPTCDTNGTQMHSSGSTRAVYGTSRGYPPPYTCLKDYRQDTPSKSAESGLCGPYTGGNKSAAEIVYQVSVACGINPRVMVVLLQKEQSLVTDDWPWSVQYRSATGFGCPDTAPCDSEYYGFFNQVYMAARQFKKYARDPHLYSYRPYRNNFILYNPNSACGGTNVYIENQATANLYIYTPYQPNAAALNNLYGTGDGCSAYGNRNFWRLYNDWFGNTIGPPYSWSIESFTFSGGDNYVAAGQTETLTLRARNTGRNYWYNHGDNPIRLATWGIDRHSSLFKSGSWLSPTRAANLTESAVGPGQIGTFTFQITPTGEGTYVEAFNLVAENAMWLQWPGFSPTIQVNNGYTWAVEDVIYSSGGGILEPGGMQWMTVKARNTGSVTWSKTSGPSIILATWGPGRQSAVNHGWLNPTRTAYMNETTVAPGEVAGFQFQVRIPSVGNYYERLNLVAEGVTWFNDPGLTLYLRGGSYSWQPLWQSISTGNPNIPAGQNFTITLKARNTGELPWRKNGTIPIRLSTAEPFNRGSALYHNSWVTDFRVVNMIEENVNPGQEATFSFTATSPHSRGARFERFSLLAEGVTWMNDPGFGVYINSY